VHTVYTVHKFSVHLCSVHFSCSSWAVLLDSFYFSFHVFLCSSFPPSPPIALVRVRGLLRRPVLFYTVLDCPVSFRSVLCCAVEMKGHALSFKAFLLFRLTFFYTKMLISLAEDTSLPFRRRLLSRNPAKRCSIFIHVRDSRPVCSSCSLLLLFRLWGSIVVRSAGVQLFLFSPCILAHVPLPSSNNPCIFAVSCPCCHIISESSICDTFLLYILHIIVHFQVQVLLCFHSC
jgi:hypothetical protein